MTKEDIIMIKNLQDGNIYTSKDIAFLVGVDVSIVENVDSYVDKNIENEIIGDGSGIIYIMDIKYDTIVDGEGFRNSVYCAKCNLFCKGCHNQQSWNIHNGRPITVNELAKLLLENGNDITFSGGECTLQCKAFIKLAKILKEHGRNIWMYSGRTYENLIKNDDCLILLKYIDVLVDGKFDINKKQLGLIFKGSTNQRILDVKKSIDEKKGVKYYAKDD